MTKKKGRQNFFYRIEGGTFKDFFLKIYFQNSFAPPIFVTQIFAPPIFMTSLRPCVLSLDFPRFLSIYAIDMIYGTSLEYPRFMDSRAFIDLRLIAGFPRFTSICGIKPRSPAS